MKFLKDGVIIAFYPVFGEVVFFYLLYQDLQKEIQEAEADVIEEDRLIEAEKEESIAQEEKSNQDDAS